MSERIIYVQAPAGAKGDKGDQGDIGPIGPQGPEGPSGAAGGDPYIHNQAVASASWVVNHNKHRQVDVTLLDDEDKVVYADIQHGSLDTFTVTLPSPMTGTAVVL